MDKLLTTAGLAFGLALTLSLFGTRIMISVAKRMGWMEKPKEDRWHKEPTAKMGGVAVYAALIVPILIFFWPIIASGFGLEKTGPLAKEILLWMSPSVVLGLLVGMTIIFILGLVDDFRYIKPRTKIFFQVVAAVVVVIYGVSSEFFNPFIGIPLTIFWIIAVTNAYNLIDNMDGLSSGTAAISSICIFLLSVIMGWTHTAILSAIMTGAALGFLRYNFKPARIFLGDSGALLIGFYLSVITIVGTMAQMSNLIIIMVVPVLVMAVPIFDTTFVTILRALSGRPISQGGRDHTSHRMVILGLSERNTVLLIYVFSLVFGIFAVLYASPKVDFLLITSLLIISLIFLILLGVFLAGVDIKELKKLSGEGKLIEGRRPLMSFLMERRERFGEILADCLIIVVSYMLAYLIIREGYIGMEEGILIAKSLPIVIFAQMVSFYFFGIYRGLWMYVAFRDIVKIVQAALVGTLASMIVLFLFTFFEGYSLSVMVVYFLLLVFFTSARLASLRGFKEYFTHHKAKRADKRVIIFGAGDSGNAVLKEILNNEGLNLRPLGFIDDDLKKVGLKINGVEVLGTRGELKKVVAEREVDEVIIAVRNISEDAVLDIQKICIDLGVSYRRAAAIL
ncbi:MAG: hypothetical protein JW984_00940 [Deltaproteobacteria bacterium]|uniref:Glycosyl transferase n=1 Tax=Candidatus Zymogenus saltonus TaxID=2844893 RepID=A0A9D8PND7_9DELT|nr:hypothetical protein [Candidatus Zymogenus saltonus]